MLAEEGLAYFITHDAAIAALIGDRYEPLVVPQDMLRPAVAYQRATTGTEYSHDGPSKPDYPTIQLTVEGRNYAEAKQVAKLIRGKLDGFKGMMGMLSVQACYAGNDVDGYSPIQQVPVVRFDVEIWCVEA